VVEVAKLHLDHTPRCLPGVTPSTALKLHHVLGRYRQQIEILDHGQPMGDAFELENLALPVDAKIDAVLFVEPVSVQPRQIFNFRSTSICAIIGSICR
jgi:hypothetical protein